MYIAYILRNGIEYEVIGELYDHGIKEEDVWSDIGASSEIIKDPEFFNLHSEDDAGNPIEFSNEEKTSIIKQMIDQYWGEL